jgi:hypothetical protein
VAVGLWFSKASSTRLSARDTPWSVLSSAITTCAEMIVSLSRRSASVDASMYATSIDTLGE